MTQAGIQDTTGNQDGAKIRRLRESRDLSVNEVASHIQIHPQALRNIELNRRGAGIDTLRKLAAAFDVTVDQLLKPAA